MGKITVSLPDDLCAQLRGMVCALKAKAPRTTISSVMEGAIRSEIKRAERRGVEITPYQAGEIGTGRPFGRRK